MSSVQQHSNDLNPNNTNRNHVSSVTLQIVGNGNIADIDINNRDSDGRTISSSPDLYPNINNSNNNNNNGIKKYRKKHHKKHNISSSNNNDDNNKQRKIIKKKVIRPRKKSKSKNKNVKNVVNGKRVQSQVEIYDRINDLEKEEKKQINLVNKSVIQKEREFETEYNERILIYAKRPYYILIFISVIFLAIFIIYWFNIFKFWLFNGLTSSIISILSILPLFILFRYYENQIILQFNIIQSKIEETFILKQKLKIKLLENLKQKRYIDDLTLGIKEHELTISKLEYKLNMGNSNTSGGKLNTNNQSLNLLHGFRKGQMDIQIEFASISELVSMLNVVVSCISLLPFGMRNYRTTLTKILETKIRNNKYLEMHFYFFLISYLKCIDVARLFRKHRIMKKIKSSDYYDYDYDDGDYDDDDDDDTDPHCVSEYESSAYTPIVSTPLYHLKNNSFDLKINNNNVNFLCFKEGDPIKLFRSPIDYNAKVGWKTIVPLELQDRFYDPINGNKYVQQLEIRKIFNSNAKPYLVDCYVRNDGLNISAVVRNRNRTRSSRRKQSFNDGIVSSPATTINSHQQWSPVVDYSSMRSSMTMTTPQPAAAPQTTPVIAVKPYNGMILSSSFILKKGDDIRKDQAVLQMFTFMNEIWRENELRYRQKHWVEALVYKCIPIGIDVGIIEMIPHCIELGKIMTLKGKLFHAHCADNHRITSKFHRLISSSAGSYIASFVCGIRDRHDDNILIDTSRCILFHIDYGYIFNNKVSLDTAKLAITSDLKTIFDLYKYGWNDFVNLSVRAWLKLRENASELIDFARVVFAFLYKSNEIELFLRDSLKLDLETENAKKYIYNKLQNAPKQWKTKIKNVVHFVAQKMKSQSNLNKNNKNNLNKNHTKQTQSMNMMMHTPNSNNNPLHHDNYKKKIIQNHQYSNPNPLHHSRIIL